MGCILEAPEREKKSQRITKAERERREQQRDPKEPSCTHPIRDIKFLVR